MTCCSLATGWSTLLLRLELCALALLTGSSASYVHQVSGMFPRKMHDTDTHSACAGGLTEEEIATFETKMRAVRLPALHAGPYRAYSSGGIRS